MSAILGMFSRTGKPVSADTLRPAMDAIAHYVTDESKIWTSGELGFGQLMLHVTPESVHETLPLTVGDLTITADARLDYRDDLFTELAIPHAERSGMPDSLLILRAYQKWGEDCPKHLLGDYAFAIWDARQQSLYCARDHIGAKPFYYYNTPEVFAFASDIRALIAFDDVKHQLDEVEIAHYLLAGAIDYVSTFYTFFRDVYKLTYGHWLTVNRETLRTERYWSPRDLPTFRLPTMDDYADQLFELVQQAVAARLRTDMPVGTHLSGGMDSSAVTVLAARLLRQQGRQPSVFSWSPPPGDDFETTEHRRILPLCQQEGLEPIYTEPTQKDQDWLFDVDISTTPVQTMAIEAVVQRIAAQRGIRVMLSGWGGDEFISFNGVGLPTELFLKGNWRTLAHFMKLRSALRHPRNLPKTIRNFWQTVLTPILPDSLYNDLKRAKNSEPYINPDFAAQVNFNAHPPNPVVRTRTSIRATQERIYENGRLTARPESWAIFGAEHGITYAYPLLDRRVLEFIYAVPGDLYFQDRKARYLHRYTMARILPQSVAWDLVKDDPALINRNKQWAAEESESANSRSTDEARWARSNPWVDVDRLHEAILEGNANGEMVKRLGKIRAALDVMTLWERWGSPTETEASAESSGT